MDYKLYNKLVSLEQMLDHLKTVLKEQGKRKDHNLTNYQNQVDEKIKETTKEIIKAIT